MATAAAAPRASATRLAWVVGLLGLSVLLNYVDRGAIGVAAPLMKQELNLSATGFGTAVSAFFWVYAPLCALVGWLCDRFCVYRMFALGIALWALATLLTGWVGGLASLIGLRLVLGLGSEALIWVDVLQCLLLLAGVLLAIGYVILIDHTGPADWWRIAAGHGQSHTKVEWFPKDITTRFTVVTALINTFFWTICTHGSDQVVLQRYFTTGSVKAARRSYFINMFVDITMALLMGTAGLALLAYYLHHADQLPSGQTATTMADKLFPWFLGHALPPGCAPPAFRSSSMPTPG